MRKPTIEEAKKMLEEDVVYALNKFYDRTQQDNVILWAERNDERSIGFLISEKKKFIVKSKVIIE